MLTLTDSMATAFVGAGLAQVGVFVGAYVRLNTRVAVIEARDADVAESLKQLGDVAREIVAIRERLVRIETMLAKG